MGPQKGWGTWLVLSLSLGKLQPWWSSPSMVPWKQPSPPPWPPRSSLASQSAQGRHNFGLLLGPGNHRFPVKGKQRHTELESSNKSLFFLPSPERWAWGLALSLILSGIAINWLSDPGKYLASIHGSVFWKMRTLAAPNLWSKVRITCDHSRKAPDTVAGFSNQEPLSSSLSQGGQALAALKFYYSIAISYNIQIPPHVYIDGRD